MMFCCTCAFSAPVINVPIWLLDSMAELILNPFAPVRSTPAWKLLIEPGPFTTTLSTFGTIIPTLELSCPGPMIENPFMLITVFGPPTMIPSPLLQLRFAVRFTTPLTTCPHAALDNDDATCCACNCCCCGCAWGCACGCVCCNGCSCCCGIATSSLSMLPPVLAAVSILNGANCGCCGSVLTTLSPLLLSLPLSSSFCFGFVASTGNEYSAAKLLTDTTNTVAITTASIVLAVFL